MSAKITGAGVLLVLVAACLSMCMTWGALGDYPSDAGPAIRALLEGDLGTFFAVQPLMGSFSILLRAPFAALALLGDGGDLLVYRLGSLPCLLAAGLLGAHLAAVSRRRGRSPLLCALIAALCLVNPVTVSALSLGHPEELLGAALCVGAALAAMGGRPIWAGALLGLALATKQWAVIAVLPVLLATSRHHARVVLVSGGVAALLTLPLVLGSPDRFAQTTHMAANTPSIAGPFNVWWPLIPSEERAIFAGTADQTTVTVHAMPPLLRGLAHPLIIALALPISLLYWRRREGARAEDALALLALLFLLRCVFDPVNNEYYHAPFLLSLAAWETVRTNGAPLLTVLACGALWGTFHGAVLELDRSVINAVYLGWTLPLAGWLAARLYGLGPILPRLARDEISAART